MRRTTDLPMLLTLGPRGKASSWIRATEPAALTCSTGFQAHRDPGPQTQLKGRPTAPWWPRSQRDLSNSRPTATSSSNYSGRERAPEGEAGGGGGGHPVHDTRLGAVEPTVPRPVAACLAWGVLSCLGRRSPPSPGTHRGSLCRGPQWASTSSSH